MSDRTEIEQILREAGLQEEAVQECLTIFTKERITSAVLPRLSVGDFRDMGIVTGDRRLLFDHLHPNSTFAEGASAPPPEAVPICDQHNQPISGLCTQPGCQVLICNDCVSVGEHRSHTVMDSLKGISHLRSQLERWEPSTEVETQIEQHRARICSLREQLVKEEQGLKKLQEQQQMQATARTRIAQSLSQTKNASPGPDALRGLKELYEMVSSLGLCASVSSFRQQPETGLCASVSFISPATGIRFTEIVGSQHKRLQISENGTKIRCVGEGEDRYIGVIDPRPINSASGTVEWTVCPQSHWNRSHWIGFGVIPVDRVPKLQAENSHTLFSGWSLNNYKWTGSAPGQQESATRDGATLKLSLDCERRTLTLTNLANNNTSSIQGIPFPVYPFVTLWAKGNELSVIV